jgi:hypothetical protein
MPPETAEVFLLCLTSESEDIKAERLQQIAREQQAALQLELTR